MPALSPQAPSSTVMTFRELYDAHFDFVFRSLRRLGVDESDARDASQEVFVVVHRKLAEFEGRSKITTWLFAICLRVASDRRRKLRTRREVDDGEAVLDHVTDEGPSADRVVEQRDLLERVLSTLPMEQRAVFVLFEVEECSGDEIAELLEIPTGTVHSRLRLARETFRAALTRMDARDRFRAIGGE